MLAITNPAWFLTANGALHLLRRDLPPATHYISEYAVGRYGWLMASALVILGIGTLSLAVSLTRSTMSGWVARTGVVLLGISGIATVLTGLCRTDIDGHGRTLAGQIHGRAAFVAILFEAVSVLLFSALFFRDGRWRSFRIVSSALAVLTVVTGALIPVLARGTGERLLVYTLVTWLFVTAIRARQVAQSGATS